MTRRGEINKSVCLAVRVGNQLLREKERGFVPTEAAKNIRAAFDLAKEGQPDEIVNRIKEIENIAWRAKKDDGLTRQVMGLTEARLRTRYDKSRWGGQRAQEKQANGIYDAVMEAVENQAPVERRPMVRFLREVGRGG